MAKGKKRKAGRKKPKAPARVEKLTEIRDRTSYSKVALCVVLSVTALAAWWGTTALISRAAHTAASLTSPSSPRIPALPDASERSKALRQALAAADRELREGLESAAPDETLSRRAGRLGQLYQANAYPEQAMMCYRLAMDSDRENARWPYYVAFLLQEHGAIDSVTELLERALALDPNYSPAWLKLAENQFKRGQNEAARASYERRLELSKGDPYAHLGLARLEQAESDWAAAESHLEQALETDPLFAAGHRMLATVHEHFGRHEQSQKALARADEAGRFYPAPDPWVDGLFEQCFDVDWLLTNAFKYAYVRDGRVANLLFNRALDLEPRNPEVYLMLGKTTQDLGQARRAFETAISLHPGNAEAHSLLGEALLKSNQPKEAERVLRKAIALGATLPTTYENLGLCLAREGRFDEAIGYIEHALSLEPEFIDFHYSRASVLREAGRRQEAIQQYRKLLSLKPTHAQGAADLAALTSRQ